MTNYVEDIMTKNEKKEQELAVFRLGLENGFYNSATKELIFVPHGYFNIVTVETTYLQSGASASDVDELTDEEVEELRNDFYEEHCKNAVKAL
jgi:hypothetical protein